MKEGLSSKLTSETVNYCTLYTLTAVSYELSALMGANAIKTLISSLSEGRGSVAAVMLASLGASFFMAHRTSTGFRERVDYLRAKYTKNIVMEDPPKGD